MSFGKLVLAILLALLLAPIVGPVACGVSCVGCAACLSATSPPSK